MKSLLAFLFLFISFQHVSAKEINNQANEIILPVSPQQKVYTRFKGDFNYHHDRGFYLSALLGPQWNHSVKEPNAKAIRFGGKLSLGGYVTDGVAIIGSAWGNFLEQASLVAVGPGVALLFDGPNLGLDFSFGIGRAFNALDGEEYQEFSETVLAANVGLAKYWWLAGNASLGVSLNTGVHGFTLSKTSIGTFGWSAGLAMVFLFG